MKIKYNKLVRDLIPMQIEEDGKSVKVLYLSDIYFKTALDAKLEEELQEYLNATDAGNALEELADMLEIIHTLAKVHGTNFKSINEIRKRKKEEKGGFNEKIFLIEVDDNERD